MKNPVEVRVGSTGAGLFVGCGLGVGFVTPVSLHAIPVLGQLVASLSASLNSLNIGGSLAGRARNQVRALGIRNFDLGFGCGVMLGYGYGAGLMLKPAALQQLSEACEARAPGWLPGCRQHVSHMQQQMAQHQPAIGISRGGTSNQPGVGSLPDPRASGQQHFHSGECLPPITASGPGHIAPASLQQRSSLAAGRQQLEGSAGALQHSAAMSQASSEEDLALLSKLVLRQQIQLTDLQQQVAALQVEVQGLSGRPQHKAKVQQ